MSWEQESQTQAAPPVVLPSRKKSEVYWAGLTGRTLAADTNVDLVTFLKGRPVPTSGTLAPFFNTTSNKLNAYNDDSSLAFKINLVGSWSTGSTNRSMQLDFVGTNGNRLVASRADALQAAFVETLALPSRQPSSIEAWDGQAAIRVADAIERYR